MAPVSAWTVENRNRKRVQNARVSRKLRRATGALAPQQELVHKLHFQKMNRKSKHGRSYVKERFTFSLIIERNLCLAASFSPGPDTPGFPAPHILCSAAFFQMSRGGMFHPFAPMTVIPEHPTGLDQGHTHALTYDLSGG